MVLGAIAPGGRRRRRQQKQQKATTNTNVTNPLVYTRHTISRLLERIASCVSPTAVVATTVVANRTPPRPVPRPPTPPHIGGVVLRQGLEVAAADGVDVALARQTEGKVGRPDHVLALGVGAEGRQEEKPRILSYYLVFGFGFGFGFGFRLGSVRLNPPGGGGGVIRKIDHEQKRPLLQMYRLAHGACFWKEASG